MASRRRRHRAGASSAPPDREALEEQKHLLSDVYTEYLKASERMPSGNKAQENIDVVRYCLTGTESCGKTALLEDLVGHKLGFTAKGTATRCPVRYQLKESEKSEWFMDGRPIDGWDGLSASMKDHMERIMKTPTGFTATAANVSISAPSIKGNLVVTDLPGLITSVSVGGDGDGDGRAAVESVRRIVAQYVRDPRVTPIVMVKPAMTTQQLLGLDMVESVFEDTSLDDVGPPRTGWRSECVAAMNKIDKLIATQDMQHADELYNLARSLRDSGFRDWFLICARAPAVNADGTPDESAQRQGADWASRDIAKSKEYEGQWFRAVLQNLPGYKDDKAGMELIDMMFGIANLQQTLDQRWLSSMVSNLIPIKEFFRRQAHTCEAEIRELVRQQEMESPDAIRTLMRQFIDTFVDQLRAMHSGTSVSQGPTSKREGERPSRSDFAIRNFYSRKECQFDFAVDECHVQLPTADEGGQFEDGFDYSNLVHAKATARRTGAAGAGTWEGYMSPQQLLKECKDPKQPLHRQLQATLSGLQRVDRFVDMMSLMSLRHATACVDKLSDSTISSASMDPSVRYNVSNKVLQLASEQLLYSRPALRWMCTGIFYVVQSYVKPIIDNILSHEAFAMLRPGAPFAPFVNRVEAIFRDVLNDELRQASVRCPNACRGLRENCCNKSPDTSPCRDYSFLAAVAANRWKSLMRSTLKLWRWLAAMTSFRASWRGSQCSRCKTSSLRVCKTPSLHRLPKTRMTRTTRTPAKSLEVVPAHEVTAASPAAAHRRSRRKMRRPKSHLNPRNAVCARCRSASRCTCARNAGLPRAGTAATAGERCVLILVCALRCVARMASVMIDVCPDTPAPRSSHPLCVCRRHARRTTP